MLLLPFPPWGAWAASWPPTMVLVAAIGVRYLVAGLS